MAFFHGQTQGGVAIRVLSVDVGPALHKVHAANHGATAGRLVQGSPAKNVRGVHFLAGHSGSEQGGQLDGVTHLAAALLPRYVDKRRGKRVSLVAFKRRSNEHNPATVQHKHTGVYSHNTNTRVCSHNTNAQVWLKTCVPIAIIL